MMTDSSAAQTNALTEEIFRLLRLQGAAAVSLCEADTVADEAFAAYTEWIDRGMHAGMEYMARHIALRRDPRLLLEGARSMICVAFSYRQPLPGGARGFATYALGDDYHDVLRRRLSEVTSALSSRFGGDWRICIDSAPVMERYWAERSGLGRRMRNGNIAVEGVGAMVFLAEILTTHPIAPANINFITGSRLPARLSVCDGCDACRRACPAAALQADGSVDSRRCLNYLTIEHRGEWTPAQRALATAADGSPLALFGCDVCLRSCPACSALPYAPLLPEFTPRPMLSGDFPVLTPSKIAVMTQTEFSTLFRGSPVKRAKLAGLRRNALIPPSDLPSAP